jgi:hypothetical protein
MPTLGDLMSKFDKVASATDDSATRSASGASPARQPAAAGGDTTKLASGGGPMNSLADLYLTLTNQDIEKRAAVAANAPAADQDDVDFAQMAEKIAEAEAAEQVASEDDGEIIKVAAEYDAAGRIMARGFFDEFCKLAESMTSAAPNQDTESESTAKTPALGERGLPTVETNFAGSPNHDQAMSTTGANAGKSNYADSLAPTKTISAGQGTGTDPEAAAIGLGGGSPVGFATIRDLQV